MINKVSGEFVYLESKMKESSPIKGGNPTGERWLLKVHKAVINSLQNNIYVRFGGKRNL